MIRGGPLVKIRNPPGRGRVVPAMPRRLLLLPVLAVAVAAGFAAFAQAKGGHGRGFRLPDASAACRAEGGVLVCRSLGVRSGLALPARGAPRAVEAPVWWDASTPVLHTFSRDGVACRDAGARIVCRNASGATISLGAQQIAVAL